jgi:hypothetical protein
MYTTTHYVTYTTQKRANVAQAAIYAVLNAKLQKYNAKHNTSHVLLTNCVASTCNTQIVVSFIILCKKYKQAVKLFNKTVKAFYTRSKQHDFAMRTSCNSFVLCNKTNTSCY